MSNQPRDKHFALEALDIVAVELASIELHPNSILIEPTASPSSQILVSGLPKKEKKRKEETNTLILGVDSLTWVEFLPFIKKVDASFQKQKKCHDPTQAVTGA